jgi:hypothetical protein
MSVRLRWAWSRSATQAAAGCQALREDVAGRADGLRQHRHPQGQRKLPAHPAVRRVNFTGRTRVGELITPPAPGTRLEGVRIPSRGSPISNRPKVAYVWLKVGTAGSRDVLDIAAGNGAHVANGIGGLGRSTDGLVWRSAGTSSAAAGRCQDRGDPGRGRSGWHPIHRARSWSLAAVSDLHERRRCQLEGFRCRRLPRPVFVGRLRQRRLRGSGGRGETIHSADRVRWTFLPTPVRMELPVSAKGRGCSSLSAGKCMSLRATMDGAGPWPRRACDACMPSLTGRAPLAP